jgi:hypothetical protein
MPFVTDILDKGDILLTKSAPGWPRERAYYFLRSEFGL